MNEFLRGRVLSKKMKCLILLLASLLVSCGDPVNIIEPVDVSIPDQSVKFKLSVKEESRYRFAFLFNRIWTGKSWRENKQLEKELYGTEYLSGVIVPVRLKILKDGVPFFDGIIDTSGTFESYWIYKATSKVQTIIRNIKDVDLPPGHYSGEIVTLKDLPEFDNNSLYFQVIDISPKANAINEQALLELEERKSKDWYMNWQLAKWIVKGIYHILFCPETLSVYKSINVNQKGDSVRIDFVVRENGHYNLLLFLDEYSKENISACPACTILEAGGNYPLLISFSKDGKVYFQRESKAYSIGSHRILKINDRHIGVNAYYLRGFYLRPGVYSVNVTTTEKMSGFNEGKAFIGLD